MGIKTDREREREGEKKREKKRFALRVERESFAMDFLKPEINFDIFRIAYERLRTDIDVWSGSYLIYSDAL